MSAYPESLESTTETLLAIARTAGEQTQPTENVRQIADKIDPEGNLVGRDLVSAVCDHVMTLVPTRGDLAKFYHQHPDRIFDKRSRTADQLLDPDNLLDNTSRLRNISGCIETGVIVRAILLAKGIPCVYTETLKKDWCENNARSFNPDDQDSPPMEGNIFIDVYLENEGKWITVDPSGGDYKIHPYRDYTKRGKEYIYPASALDSWGLGYRNMGSFQGDVADYFRVGLTNEDAV